MKEDDCRRERIFKIINTLIGEYLNIFGHQMISACICDIKIDIDLFTSMVLLTINDDEMLQNEDRTSVNTMVQRFFLKQTESGMPASVKGYFPSVEEVGISLLFIRCLWIYQNIMLYGEKEKYALLLLEIPTNVLYKEKKEKYYERFNRAFLPFPEMALSPLDADGYSINEVKEVATKMLGDAESFLSGYSQVTETFEGYRTRNYLTGDVLEMYKQCFMDFLKGDTDDAAK